MVTKEPARHVEDIGFSFLGSEEPRGDLHLLGETELRHRKPLTSAWHSHLLRITGAFNLEIISSLQKTSKSKEHHIFLIRNNLLLHLLYHFPVLLITPILFDSKLHTP